VESDESTDEELVDIPGGQKISKNSPGPASYEHTLPKWDSWNRTMTSPDQVSQQAHFFMSSEERFARNPMLFPKEGPGPGDYEISTTTQSTITKPKW